MWVCVRCVCLRGELCVGVWCAVCRCVGVGVRMCVRARAGVGGCGCGCGFVYGLLFLFIFIFLHFWILFFLDYCVLVYIFKVLVLSS